MFYVLCCALLCVQSNFEIILMGKRELVALLCLCSLCLVIVVWLSFTMSWICLRFVIVVFPVYTHLLFLEYVLYLNLYVDFLNFC